MKTRWPIVRLIKLILEGDVRTYFRHFLCIPRSALRRVFRALRTFGPFRGVCLLQTTRVVQNTRRVCARIFYSNKLRIKNRPKALWFFVWSSGLGNAGWRWVGWWNIHARSHARDTPLWYRTQIYIYSRVGISKGKPDRSIFNHLSLPPASLSSYKSVFAFLCCCLISAQGSHSSHAPFSTVGAGEFRLVNAICLSFSVHVVAGGRRKPMKI